MGENGRVPIVAKCDLMYRLPQPFMVSENSGYTSLWTRKTRGTPCQNNTTAVFLDVVRTRKRRSDSPRPIRNIVLQCVRYHVFSASHVTTDSVMVC